SVITTSHAEIEELRAFVGTNEHPSFGGIRDIRNLLHKIEIEGSTIYEDEGLPLLETFRGMRLLRDFFAKRSRQTPTLWKTAVHLFDDRMLEMALDSIFEANGTIKDTASPELRGIRREIIATGERLRTKLAALMKRYIVSHNFPKRPEKGVKVTSIFNRNKLDSNWYLSGDWKTTKTKKYYAISGKVELKEEKDLELSKIFPHLEELGLDKNIPFYTAYKKEKEAALVKKTAPPVNKTDVAVKKPDASVVKTNPVNTVAIEKKNTDVAKTELPKTATASGSTVTMPETPTKKTTTTTVTSAPPVADEKKEKTIAKTEPAVTESLPNKPVTKPEAITTKTNNNVTVPAVTNEKKNTDVVKVEPPKTTTNTSNVIAKPETTIAKTNTTPVTTVPVVTNEKKTVAAVKSEPQKTITKPETPIAKTNTIPETVPKVADEKKNNTIDKVEPPKIETASNKVVYKPVDRNAPAAFVAERVTDKPQELTYVSDSLVLILYDNGEVDGDTVSVLLNGEMLMAKQRLTTAAIRKTIYITPGNEELTLLLYAENLGKYPPNTGLLVIYDGEERYQLRFSADLSKNASVVFRRKK
ncbi:MAG TPA: hypothetical protein VF487_20835, partial [Chitinophagaceae bacterium]